ncbi:hypothetical protein D1007_22505 [Hordeum vulgare]|nr:hypothetical protein D1007_22505 [Hordeum vulgare]
MEYEEESSDDNSQDYSGMLYENSQDDKKYEGADNCGFVEWVDPYWPIPMQNVVLKLWQIEYKKEYEGQKAEITRKEGENERLNEKYVILQNLTRAQGKMIQNLKCNHLKEKERLIEQRRNMQLQISHLQEVLAKSEAKNQ